MTVSAPGITEEKVSAPLPDIHLKDIRNRVSFEFHGKGFTVVAFALTIIALDMDIRKEVHLDNLHSTSLARLAATTFDIEGEPSRLVTTNLGLW